jgi:hypothetical protein
LFGPDEVLTAFDGKYNVNVNLRIRIGHAQKMPPLTGLGNLFWEFVLQIYRPYGPASDLKGRQPVLYLDFPFVVFNGIAQVSNIRRPTCVLRHLFYCYVY